MRGGVKAVRVVSDGRIPMYNLFSTCHPMRDNIVNCHTPIIITCTHHKHIILSIKHEYTQVVRKKNRFTRSIYVMVYI